MKPTFLRTEFNYDRDEASHCSGLECTEKTLAQQHFKDECDINVLFGKYLETGLMPQVEHELTYANFEGVYDFQTAMNAVRKAEEVFQQLPARIKNRFDNSPQRLIEFLDNPDNRDEAIFLKLVEPAILPDAVQPKRRATDHETGNPRNAQTAAQSRPPTGGTADGQGTPAKHEAA